MAFDQWVHDSDGALVADMTENLCLAVFFMAGKSAAERGWPVGHDMPTWVTGWRYGDLPGGGRSFNFQDQRYEFGVSMMHVDGDDFKGSATYAMFNRRGKRRVHAEGWMVTHVRGSDGEPLLACAVESNA